MLLQVDRGALCLPFFLLSKSCQYAPQPIFAPGIKECKGALDCRLPWPDYRVWTVRQCPCKCANGTVRKAGKFKQPISSRCSRCSRCIPQIELSIGIENADWWAHTLARPSRPPSSSPIVHFRWKMYVSYACMHVYASDADMTVTWYCVTPTDSWLITHIVQAGLTVSGGKCSD
jgi:hypothetical protein